MTVAPRAGYRYRTRNGQTTGVVRRDPDNERYVWTDGTYTWAESGRFYVTSDSHEFDLVEEVSREPAEPASPANLVLLDGVIRASRLAAFDRPMQYMLNAARQPVTASPGEYAQWRTSTDEWVVCHTHDDGKFLSTVFIGLDLRYAGDGPPILFETMLFEGDNSGVLDRYATWQEAMEGHEQYAKEHGLRISKEPVQPVATPKGRKVRL